MFTRVEIRNNQGGLLTLQLGDSSNGFVVHEFAGLDPVKATMVSSTFANLPGAQYQSSHRETRNITIKLGFDADPAVTSVRALRQHLYNFFMPQSEVTMSFFMDDIVDVPENGCVIVGRVETCNTPLFVQEPAVDISIICFDPDFYNPTPATVTGMTTADTVATDIPYVGTIGTGLTVTVNVNRALTEFTIYHTDPNGNVQSLDFVASLIAGDVVTINTVSGSKVATLNRAGVITSVLYGVSPQSTWVQLSPGDNQLKVYAVGASIPVTVDYTTKFGGL